MSERSYTTFQVADLLGALPSTVNEWIKKGWLPCQQASGGPARISERGLTEFLKRRGIEIENVMADAALRAGRSDDEPAVAADGAGGAVPAVVKSLPSEPAGAPDATGQIADAVLRDAVTRAASAIHLEPGPGGLSLRLRIHGIMHDKVNFRLRLPKTAAPALIGRLKSMAGLDLTESQRPQSGSFTWTVEGREIPFQASSCPMAYGERMVVLVLDPERVLPGLSDLHLPEGEEDRLRRLLAEPCGIIMMVAPGRSERATTLRAMVQALSGRQRSIVTVETSAKLAVEGVSQSRINPAAGYSFADAVEALAGQDADAILVEEIRDSRTAAGVVDLASEGRLVLIGMGARSAAEAVAAMAELCGEPYLLSSALLAVVEQRTVRGLCDECRIQTVPDRKLLERVGLRDASFPVWSAGGCTRCANTGYSGTVTLSAVMEVNGAMAWSIRAGGDAGAFGRAATLAGAKSFGSVVLESLKAGTTSLEEIARVLPRGRTDFGLGGPVLS